MAKHGTKESSQVLWAVTIFFLLAACSPAVPVERETAAGTIATCPYETSLARTSVLPQDTTSTRAVGELMSRAATECRENGYPLEAGALHLLSARAFTAAGDTAAAVNATSEALILAFERPAAAGAGWDPTGGQAAREAEFRAEQQRLRSAALSDAAAIETLIRGGGDITVRITTDPPNQLIRYWSVRDGPAATFAVTTNDSVRVQPQMYFFTRRRSDGVVDTIPKVCNRSCVVAFPPDR